MCAIIEDYAQDMVTEVLIESAQKMIADGMSNETIAKYINLSIEEIEALRTKE